MSFTLAALIVVALASSLLGLVCYHLLSRLNLLERAVQGGLEPPTRRLSREEFERRFAVAEARSELARRFDTGVVFFIGDESDRDHKVTAAIDSLSRPDLVHVVSLHSDQIPSQIGGVDVVPIDSLGIEPDRLDVATTPFAFVVDNRRIRAARPLSGTDDLALLLREYA